MTPRLFLPFAIFPVMVVLWAGPAWGQAAAPELPEDSEVRGPLRGVALKKIDAYIDYWVARMKSAKDIRKVVEARQGLVNGYRRHAAAYYQHACARSAAARIVGLLSDADRAKQIQAAMAMSDMPQITIQPALEKMAGHKNPAVRYWAVKGYRQAVRLLMIQGGNFAKRMLTTLEKLGTTDASGPIVAGVLIALIPYPEAGRQDVAKLRGVFDRVWLARCKDVWAGKIEIIEAFRKVEGFVVPANAADRKRVLQLLADAMEAGTLGLLKALNKKGPGVKRLRELLLRFETKLGQTAGVQTFPLQTMLGTKVDVEQATVARLRGWLEHWLPALKKLGVTPRFVVAPAAATSTQRTPATTSTAPAGG